MTPPRRMRRSRMRPLHPSLLAQAAPWPLLPAAAMPAAPPKAAGTPSAHAAGRPAAAPKAGPDSRSTACSLSLAMAARLVAHASRGEGSGMDAPRPSVPATGGTARLGLIPAWAMASASVRPLLAVPGSISLAPLMDLPGRYPTSAPFARHPRTTREPTPSFWSTTARAASPASSSGASTSSRRSSTRRPTRISPPRSSPTARWKDFPTSTPRHSSWGPNQSSRLRLMVAASS